MAGPRSRPSGDTTPRTNHPVQRDGRNSTSPVHWQSCGPTSCNAEGRSLNTESTSQAHCCEFCVPCDYSQGTTATGQCSWTSYAFCSGWGTPCVGSEPPPTSEWGWSHPIWHMYWTLAEKTLDTLDNTAAFEVLSSMSRELENLSEDYHSLRHCRRLPSGVSSPRTNHPDDTEDGGGSAEPVS